MLLVWVSNVRENCMKIVMFWHPREDRERIDQERRVKGSIRSQKAEDTQAYCKEIDA